MGTPSDWIRPNSVIIDGKLEFGLELAVVDGVIEDIRSATGPPEPYVLSPAFVNAHSHLEYRGMLDQIPHPEYYEWIYELTRLKPLETPEFVREQCLVAARENRRTGVAWIGEHSDRPGSVEAMLSTGLGGWVFHEVITSGSPDVAATLAQIEARLQNTNQLINPHRFARTSLTDSPVWESDLASPKNQTTSLDREVGEPANRVSRSSEASNSNIGASLNPHAHFTVDRDTLRQLGANGQPSSIHVAETIHESNFTRNGTGPIADRRRAHGVQFDIYGQSVVEVLDDLGVIRPGMQCVHCCDVDDNDIAIMASRGVTIAHCPRSNVRLQCPIAPIREFLDAGITVGLGMDSPASGGPIDMFAEMRCALSVSHDRGKPLTGEEIWRMATNEGYKSFGKPKPEAWDIYIGSSTPLIQLDIRGATETSDLIELGSPSAVSWLA